MILGFKPPPDGPYWYGKVNSVDKKFIRCMAGLMMPHVDRQVAAVVVLAELHRSSSPADLTAVGADVCHWAEIEKALIQFHKDLQFDTIIVENEAARRLLWRIPQLTPCLTYAAPAHAVGEVGRQKTDAMIGEGKLHLEQVETLLGHEPEQGGRAIQLVVTWAQEFPAFYRVKKTAQPEYKKVWGTAGL
jgi:hypothetical protein